MVIKILLTYINILLAYSFVTKVYHFTLGNSGSICLPVTKELQDKDLAGERGIVAGWGLVNSTTTSNIRLKVELPIFSKTTCNIYYKR